jgi:NADH:ubiquinone oxidoreductase subunit D
MEEMRQSNHIIKQCVDWLRENPGSVMSDDKKVAPPKRTEMKDDRLILAQIPRHTRTPKHRPSKTKLFGAISRNNANIYQTLFPNTIISQ